VVTTLSRLWYVLAEGVPPDTSGLIQRLAARPLAAIAYAPSPECTELARRLSPASSRNARVAPELAHGHARPLDAFARLAREHIDSELLLVGGAAPLMRAIEASLGLRSDQASQAPVLRNGALFAFNWPTGNDPEARPELIGLDLDWLPPWRAGQPRSAFPGGPGVAGTSRA
jgi:hypothetical protein